MYSTAQGAETVPRGGERKQTNAKRTARAEAPGGRNRQRSSHCSHCDRRTARDSIAATSQAKERFGGGEGAGGEHDSRGPFSDCQEGRCGSVGLMPVSSNHPASAISVANWFLERSWREPESLHCDQMKLYKLTYYANAWYLGNGCGELFQEDVKAWPHGPVVPDLYGQFKKFGRNRITELGKRLEPRADGGFGFVVPRHDGSLDSFFESVWNVYKDKSGIQLSNMTHMDGEPWTIVAESYGYDLSSKPTIPSEIIEAVFARRVEQGTIN